MTGGSKKQKRRPRCVGFGEHEGTCRNQAGSTHSKLWCQRCDDLRLAHLDRQFRNLSEFFEGPR